MPDHVQLLRSPEEDGSPSSESDSSWIAEADDVQLGKALLEKPILHSRRPSFETPQFKWPCLRPLQRKLRLAGLGLLPSFVSLRIVGRKPESKNSQNVASLDGLRGVACLLVFNQHFSFNYSQKFLKGWDGEDRRWIIQLPIIRLLWAGDAMVAIFFVISGYVLSYKLLKQMHSNSDQVFRTLNSAIVRRGIRLYLPNFIATFMCMLLVQAGAFEAGRKAYKDGWSLLSAHEDPPHRFDTFAEQFWHWWETAVLKPLYPWTWQDTWQNYDPHLWTIPTEFRCSMLLFLVQCGVSRLRLAFRVAVLAIAVFYSAFTDAEQITLFLVGMLMAQIDVIKRSRADTRSWPPFASSKDMESKSGCRKRIIWIATFVAGLYLASTPSVSAEDSTGYVYLVNELVPEGYRTHHYFWQSIGAVTIVYSASHSEDIKPIFTNSFAQYLGKISYALYIVHGNILRSVLYGIMPTIREMCGNMESDFGFVLAWLMGACVIVPMSFWAADLFWRLVDMPCVKFARWVEQRVSEEDKPSGRRRDLLIA